MKANIWGNFAEVIYTVIPRTLQTHPGVIVWSSHSQGIHDLMNLTPSTVQRNTDGLTTIIKSYVSDLPESYVFDVLFKVRANDPGGVEKRHVDNQEGGRRGVTKPHNVQAAKAEGMRVEDLLLHPQE